MVIVAAGRGERAGASVDGPKQYRRIGGKPVLTHTIGNFLSWMPNSRIVVVIHQDDETLFRSVRDSLPADSRISSVFGKATRQGSVLAGLEELASTAPDFVMIHDAVRPFFTAAMLERILFAHQQGAKAVLPAIAVTDTLKRGSGEMIVTETVPREGLFGAQTPQSFDYPTILQAHRAAFAAGHMDFTDDTAIAEWRGSPVKLVEGEKQNVKLTLQADLVMADEKLGSSMLPDVRTGNGYDVHSLEPGDGVTLCGVYLPHDQRLNGHSDADAALHALTDALLATCGAGDIGDHFPPTDPQWKGAPSRIFLEHAAKIVRNAGGTIMNADISIIAEAPKIGPRRQEMRQNLSDYLGITIDRCSVKATTNEKIGFVGRREGIAAIATATVIFGRRDG